MIEPKRIEIVRRAYRLWQLAGHPEGRDEELYQQARQELSCPNAQQDLGDVHPRMLEPSAA
jgi:hypothetical protein